MKEGDPVTIVCTVQAVGEPVLYDHRYAVAHANVTHDGHGWIAEEKGGGVCNLVPIGGEGVIWERGWTDGQSLLAAFKLWKSAR